VINYEISIVKRIFDLRLELLGYRAIANILNKEEVPCPKRGRWRNKDQKWSHNTINAILSNPIYTGKMVFNRHPKCHVSGPTKKVWKNDEKDWIIKEDAHPVIITKEIFELANKARQSYKRQNRFYYESPYLLSGLLKCIKCGFNFQGQTKKVTSKSKKGDNDQTTLKYYYEDGGYSGKGKSVCKSNLLRKKELEDVIIKHIVKRINQGNFISKVTSIIQSKLRNNNDPEQKVSALNKQIEKCNKSLKNLVQMVSGGIDIKEVRDEISSIQKERDFLEKELFSLKNESFDDKDISKLVTKVQSLITDFERIFRDSPVHIQKKLIRLFVDKIEVEPENCTINYYIRNVPWIDDKLSKKFEFGNVQHKAELYPLIKADRRNAHIASAN
jgi:site-specific DNA recombinase